MGCSCDLSKKQILANWLRQPIQPNDILPKGCKNPCHVTSLTAMESSNHDFFVPVVRSSPQALQGQKAVSAVVFTNSVPDFAGGLQKMLFSESPIKIGV